MEPALAERSVLPGAFGGEPVGGSAEPGGSGPFPGGPRKIASRDGVGEGGSTGVDATAANAEEAPPRKPNTQALTPRSKEADSEIQNPIEAANGTGDLNPAATSNGTAGFNPPEIKDGSSAQHLADGETARVASIDLQRKGDGPGNTRMECPGCGETGVRTLFHGRDRLFHTTDKSFLLVECKNCRLIRLEPRPSLKELSLYYPPEDWYAPDEYAAFTIE